MVSSFRDLRSWLGCINLDPSSFSITLLQVDLILTRIGEEITWTALLYSTLWHRASLSFSASAYLICFARLHCIPSLFATTSLMRLSDLSNWDWDRNWDISDISESCLVRPESQCQLLPVTPIPKGDNSITQITREPPSPASSVLKGTMYLED